MREFVAKSIDKVKGVQVSIMGDTRSAIDTGLLRPDTQNEVSNTVAPAVVECSNCGETPECQHRVLPMNDTFVKDGVLYRAPQFYEHQFTHTCNNEDCRLVGAKAWSTIETSRCVLCHPESLATEQGPQNLLRGQTHADGSPKELSVLVLPDGETGVHMHMQDLIPDADEPPPIPSDFQKLVSRFAAQNFLGCFEFGATLLRKRPSFEVIMLTLISGQRSGMEDQAVQLGEMVKPAFSHDPWIECLLALTLGDVGVETLTERAKTAEERCRLHFYAGARFRTEGKSDLARQHLEKAVSEEVSCVEKSLVTYEQRAKYPTEETLATRYVEGEIEEHLKLAIVHHSRSDFDAAIGEAREALELAKERLPDEHSLVAQSMSILSTVLLKSGKHEEAEDLAVETLALTRKIYGTNDHRYAICVDNVAGIRYRLGHYNVAQELFREALDVFAVTIGKRHKDYAICLDNLGMLCAKLGQTSEGIDMVSEAEKILEEVAGPTHPDTIRAKQNHVGLLGRLFDQAIIKKFDD